MEKSLLKEIKPSESTELPLSNKDILESINTASKHYRNKGGCRDLGSGLLGYESPDTVLRIRISNHQARQAGISIVLIDQGVLNAVTLRTPYPDVPMEANNLLVLQFQTKGKDSSFIHVFQGTVEKIEEEMMSQTDEIEKSKQIWLRCKKALIDNWHK